jgi:hypothetical protein
VGVGVMVTPPPTVLGVGSTRLWGVGVSVTVIPPPTVSGVGSTES